MDVLIVLPPVRQLPGEQVEVEKEKKKEKKKEKEKEQEKEKEAEKDNVSRRRAWGGRRRWRLRGQ